MSFEPSETVSRELWDHLVSTFALGHDGDHGKDHWLRVLSNGREIAAATGANLRVVELFAALHDSKRENEYHDPQHGPRAAEHARSLCGKWFNLDVQELEVLCRACELHADGLTTDGDPTVLACWDADRLDLGRVGIKPHPTRLCTKYAKREDVLEAAYERSLAY